MQDRAYKSAVKGGCILLLAVLVAALSLLTNSETHAQAPSTPALTARAPEAGAIELSWNAVSGAAQYDLWARTSAGAWEQLDDGALTGTTFLHTGLIAGTTYWYSVRALAADGGESGWSAYPSATAGQGLTGTATPTVTPSTTAAAPDAAAERAALVALYQAADGANWTQNDNWLSDEPLAHWYGVTTDVEGHLISLELKSNGLSGQIPDLSALTKLQVLDLSNNALSGQIPDLNALTALTLLSLSSNELNGSIPDFSAHTNLLTLDLGLNEFSGPIPDLGALVNLTELHLGGNELSGSFPELGSLVLLEELDLSDLGMTGPIPDLGMFTNLTKLNLAGNHLCLPDGVALSHPNADVAAHLQGLALPLCT